MEHCTFDVEETDKSVLVLMMMMMMNVSRDRPQVAWKLWSLIMITVVVVRCGELIFHYDAVVGAVDFSLPLNLTLRCCCWWRSRSQVLGMLSIGKCYVMLVMLDVFLFVADRNFNPRQVKQQFVLVLVINEVVASN